MNVAIYCRVSTADQSADLQRVELEDYCRRRGFDVAGIFIDRGISGTKDRRPALDQLMADVRRGKFQAVIVWRFDRFARSVHHLVMTLEEFRSIGVDFISFQETIDTTTPLGRAVFAIVAAMAELERSIIQDRVKAGLRRAREKGKKIGRPSIAEAARREVRKIEHAGKTVRAIAAAAAAAGLKISKSTVHKTLQNQAS